MKINAVKQYLKFWATLEGVRRPILLVSAPGMGKSQLVEQVAAETYHEIIVLIGSIMDPTEISGLPYHDQGDRGKIARWAPFGPLARILEAKSPTICFMDDVGQSSRDVQAAFMQLVEARSVNGHEVPECVSFILATNRTSDGAGVSGLLDPLINRTTIINVESDVDVWADFISQDPLCHSAVVDFARYCGHVKDPIFDYEIEASGGKPTRVKGKDIVASATPRSLHRLGRELLAAENVGFTLPFDIIEGYVGPRVAPRLVGFLRIASQLPSVDRIVADPEGFEIPESPEIVFALMGHIKKNLRKGNVKDLTKFLVRLPLEFFTLLLVWEAKEKAGRSLLLSENNPKIIKWIMENKDLFL